MAEEKIELRKLAEASLAGKSQLPDSLSGLESRELIRELQTYQAELEIQNEELRRVEINLREAGIDFLICMISHRSVMPASAKTDVFPRRTSPYAACSVWIGASF